MAFRELGVGAEVHVATKVRLAPDELDDIQGHVRSSVAGSLARLGLEQVTLLQLHNSITAKRGDAPTSVTPQDVLGRGGVLEVFGQLRSEGKVRHLGLTGIGQPGAMGEVVRSGEFETMQTPFNVLNPSAGYDMPAQFQETNYGNIIAECASRQMGVFAIRVFAGGALAGNPPSAHTYKTKFFPLDLFRRDSLRAARLRDVLPPGMGVKEAAVRFAISHADVSSALIGFGDPSHVDEALGYLGAGPLPPDLLNSLVDLDYDEAAR
jgi:aryl-alcohol dehydrogenase-like predicted oxidoreductase